MHLLETLLNEAGQEDEYFVATSLHFVVLEEDVCAEKLNGFVNDVVGCDVRVVLSLWSDWQECHTEGLLRLFAIEL